MFNTEVFKDIGRAYLVSILDIEGINPVTRILKNLDEPFNIALERIKKDIERDLLKPLAILKAKKGAKRNKFKPDFEIVVTVKNKLD